MANLAGIKLLIQADTLRIGSTVTVGLCPCLLAKWSEHWGLGFRAQNEVQQGQGLLMG